MLGVAVAVVDVIVVVFGLSRKGVETAGATRVGAGMNFTKVGGRGRYDAVLKPWSGWDLVSRVDRQRWESSCSCL